MPSQLINSHSTGGVMASVPEKSGGSYSFPTSRLMLRGVEPDKEPLVLVGCGSFSPITYLHLRMFYLAADYVRVNTNFTIVGMYLSPVGDSYKKKGLVEAHHRLKMAELAAEATEAVMVDRWEAVHQSEYVPTDRLLTHFDHEINAVLGGVTDAAGRSKPAKVALLAGADLIATMRAPLWTDDELEVILGRYGAFVVERSGVDIPEALEVVRKWEGNIHYIEQTVPNDTSSTKVRALLKKNFSIDFLIPAAVIRYIREHRLYSGDEA